MATWLWCREFWDARSAWVISYIENQKDRHKRGDISERLEIIEDNDG